ncbi:enoyl-CoA hydratase/isomerase family protein [Paroceanicella profunda]|uniref:Enoyl-CoA hydratase/isomerase family protein n=1 Tax=Paroceanicella profunda TaxID=2579971 RepID=A0A5B8FGA1_9RHOB|nr:enoyl-CoA hydratase/isomerase family protein [Paroceanicella profunda]QDL90877.1 enoyl-CoA hydratase/isomerase family protein [Paroceanicella profunda]
MIESVVEGPVARITLARPERHNALDREAMAALTAELDRLAALPELRALVLTGTGRSFCSGAALDGLAADWTRNPLTALCDRLEAFPRPTVCALNGGAYGGGVELALACDFRIGVEGMRLFVPPAKLGIHYEPAGISRALRVMGQQATRRLFLLAETFGDTALRDLGFLDHLVAPEALGPRVEALVEEIAALAPLAVSGMKRTITELATGTLDAEAARGRIAACFASADHAEGLAAMRDKRTPRFTGA